MTFTHHHHKFNWVVNIIGYAPAVFFVVMLVGMIVDVQLPTPFIPQPVGWIVGLVAVLGGTIVVFWSQRERRTLYIPVTDRSCFNFYKGPYKISRHPTYLGLFCMLAGLGFLINSLIIVGATSILFVLFTLFVIPQEEKALEDLCGGVYKTYKKQVRMWL